MIIKKLNFCAAGALAICVMCFCPTQATEEQGIQWNQDANSLVLNTTELAKLGETFPAWKIKQIVFPSAEEISSKSVIVDEKLKNSCIGWQKKFIRDEQLPVDINRHLVPMKNWGLIMKESEQKLLCDVFVVRFKKGPYVIHIQESPYNVVIVVTDERLVKNPRLDHKQLITEMAATVLNDALKPDPNSGNFHEHAYESGSDSHKISSVTWGIDSLITIDSTGRKALNLSKAGEIGTTHVNAETNGRFVKFEIIKCPGAVKAAFFDPYEERFRPTK